MEPFIAEIRMFAGNFAPNGWALCDGQILSISQNTALFSLLGTTYGGDGRATFGLPDLRGRSPLGVGQGQGLSEYVQGEMTGQAQVSLLQQEIPAHFHTLKAFDTPGTSTAPTDRSLARSTEFSAYGPVGSPVTSLAPASLSPAGGSQPHNNMPPFLAVNFIIALVGIFPQRP